MEPAPMDNTFKELADRYDSIRGVMSWDRARELLKKWAPILQGTTAGAQQLNTAILLEAQESYCISSKGTYNGTDSTSR